jgi:hypothetical protein
MKITVFFFFLFLVIAWGCWIRLLVQLTGFHLVASSKWSVCGCAKDGEMRQCVTGGGFFFAPHNVAGFLFYFILFFAFYGRKKKR